MGSGILGRLNGIVKFIENPCNEPWMVYVEAAKPWAGKAAMAFLGVDWNQSVRTALSGGELRTGRHLRGGKTINEHEGSKKMAFPDPYEWLGQHWRQAIKDWLDSSATWGSKAIFTVTGQVEHGLWQYMILDQTSEFLYRSLADARHSKYCNRWNGGSAMRSGPMGALGILGWQAMINGSLKYDSEHVKAPFGAILFVGDGQGSCEVVGSWSGIVAGGAGAAEYGMRIRNGFTGEVITQEGPFPTFRGQPIECIVSCRMDCPGYAIIELYSYLGDLVGEGIIWATATYTPKPPPIPPVKPQKWKQHKKWPKRHHEGEYQTSDGSTVYPVARGAWRIKPPAKPKK